MQGAPGLGRHLVVHGARPAPSEPRASRRVDLADVGLLLLVPVLAAVSFLVANYL